METEGEDQYFKAFEAKLTLVAVWVRSPKLPIEFYDASVLKEIGVSLVQFYALTLTQPRRPEEVMQGYAFR